MLTRRRATPLVLLILGGALLAQVQPAQAQSAPVARSGPSVSPLSFRLGSHSVAPKRAYFAGTQVRIAFRFEAAAPLDLDVEVVRLVTGRPVRRFTIRRAQPFKPQRLRLRWNGVTTHGYAAPDARYFVRVRPRGGGAKHRLGAFVFHGHIYPIRGPHRDRGGIGYFGAPRGGGRVHEGFDVDAACGTPLAAARGGIVTHSAYDPVLYGNLVIIHGAKSHRDYWYAHLAHPSPLRNGDRVRTGQRIGRIGATGNARTIGCHLHFEIRSRGRPIDPAPELHAWDRWS